MPEIVTLTVNPAIDIATSVERMTDTQKTCAVHRPVLTPAREASTSPASFMARAEIAWPSTLPGGLWPSDWRGCCRQKGCCSNRSGSKGSPARIFRHGNVGPPRVPVRDAGSGRFGSGVAALPELPRCTATCAALPCIERKRQRFDARARPGRSGAHASADHSENRYPVETS